MAVPKKKTSPSRRGMRRSHKKVSFQQMATCPKCSELKYPHHMCLRCGHYNGRQVIVTKEQRREQKAAEAEAN
jgi:large subunit ribosomal protein L32